VTVPSGGAVPSTTVAIHIGAHKTGTSLVQSYLRTERDNLAAEGIRVLGRDQLGEFSVWGRRLINEPEALRARLDELAAGEGCDVIFGSNENVLGRPFGRGGRNLYPQAGEVAEALALITAGYRTKIIFSIRPQADFLESYYLQTIHQGEHENFDTWFGRLDRAALSWRPVIERLTAALGAEAVEVVDFRRIKDGPGPFLEHIFARIDERFDFDITFSETRNPSISEKGLQMALAANPLLRDDAERRLMRVFLQKHFSNVHYPRPALLSEAQRRELEERYGAEYEMLVALASRAAGPEAT
jgi:hypothetical protein